MTDPTLQPLLAQYVPLELKIDDPEFAIWTSRYKPTGRGIPMIFIVSAEGQEIYNRSGAPAGDGLAALLMQGIQQTGGMKNPAAAGGAAQEKLVKTLTAARRLLGRGETAAAIALLVPMSEAQPAAPGQPAGESGLAAGTTQPAAEAAGPADPQTQLRQLIEELQQQAGGDLEAAMQRLQDPQQQLIGAVQLLRVQRLYAGLPEIGSAIEEARQAIAGLGEGETLLEQAQLIDKAREFEERKNKRSATAAYRKVVTAHPGSLAARLSQQRIAQLGGEPVVASGPAAGDAAGSNLADAASTAADESPREWTDRSGQFSVTAALVGFDAQSVQLRKQDGQVVTVPLAALSDESRQYVATRAAP